MKKNILTIILAIIAVAFMGVSVYEYIAWKEDVEIYEAGIREYENSVSYLIEYIEGTSSDLIDEKKAFYEIKNKMVQMQAELDAYKKAVDDINAERLEKNRIAEEKAKEKEDRYNALSEEQKKALAESQERGRIINYLLYNNEEYAECYNYMRELNDKGLVELSNSEYKTYKAKKARMIELEKEYKETLKEQNEE